MTGKESFRLYAAIATPFDENNSVDVGAMVSHAKWLLTEGCDGLVVFGTTGEAVSLTKEERMAHDKIITITEGSVTNAFRTELDNPYGEFLVKTLNDKFGEDVVQIRIMGGTVPIAPFINELKIPAFIVPMVNPDNNQHSPNENLKIGQIAYGIKAFYGILSSEL